MCKLCFTNHFQFLIDITRLLSKTLIVILKLTQYYEKNLYVSQVYCNKKYKYKKTRQFIYHKRLSVITDKQYGKIHMTQRTLRKYSIKIHE